jgi:hypothetical protein
MSYAAPSTFRVRVCPRPLRLRPCVFRSWDTIFGRHFALYSRIEPFTVHCIVLRNCCAHFRLRNRRNVGIGTVL